MEDLEPTYAVHYWILFAGFVCFRKFRIKLLKIKILKLDIDFFQPCESFCLKENNSFWISAIATTI